MAAEPMRTGAVVAALAFWAAAVAAAEMPAPGVKRVCVPAEDGRTWECGTTDDPPPQRGLAPRESPPPPSFLAPPGAAEVMPLSEAPAPAPEPIAPRSADIADPARETETVAGVDSAASDDDPVPAPVVEDASPAAVESAAAGSPPRLLAAPPRPGYSPGPPVVSEPVAANDPAPAPEPTAPAEVASVDEPPAAAEPAEVAESTPPEAEVVVDRQSESQPEPESQPPAPEPRRDSMPEPEAVDAEASAAIVAPDAAVAPAEPAAAIAPTVEPASAEPEPAAPAPLRGPEAQPLDAGAFLALPGGDYTVQLAHARTREGFAPLLASLGLDPASAYALPFDRDGVRWWMLAWSSFPDAASARAAFSRLPRDAGANVGYPRRIALIQAELRP